MNAIDASYVEGLRSMKGKAVECINSQRMISKIDISSEGEVRDSMVLCILADKEAGNADNSTGCMQLLYFGSYSENITTEPYYSNKEDKHYFMIRLIDTTRWVSYSWMLDSSVPVKEEMKIRLRYSGDKSNYVEFE